VVASLEPEKSISYELGPGYGAYLYVVSGEVDLDGVTLSQGDAANIIGESVEVRGNQESEIAMVVVRV
jgi:redox-sensitive bicupin YhaK (pirin superfamily)